MIRIAYIANAFPSPLEPYVVDEIEELRRRGARVICCSGRRAPVNGLTERERGFHREAIAIYPPTPSTAARVLRRFGSEKQRLLSVLATAVADDRSTRQRPLRSFAHTLLGVALAEELVPYEIEHIHAHHGYFASWMALVAAHLLGVGFSFTLHGSDLLLGRGDLLAAKLARCRFCVTISNYNRDYILRKYASIPAGKIVVQRLGVNAPLVSDDRAVTAAEQPQKSGQPFVLLSVGRLHRVKNYEFLIDACAALRDSGMSFICRIVGEGTERARLERRIHVRRLERHVLLPGHVPRSQLGNYYRQADLFVLTSRSEGIPVTLMEAMAHSRIVLAPAITGIPELVQHTRSGFLYEDGSMADFLSAVRWIERQKDSLAHVRLAAAETIAASYDRERNIRRFADKFLTRIGQTDGTYAHSLLQ